MLAVAAMSALSMGTAYVPHAPGFGGALGQHRAVEAYSGTCVRRGARDWLLAAGAVNWHGRPVHVLRMTSDGEDDDGGQMVRRPAQQRPKKEMPTHVQDVLREVSTREDPVSDPMRLNDFKGLSDRDKAASKTINNELYVKGLPFDLDHEGVRKLFVKAGHKPKSVRILKDRKDKERSLGFGFVRFKTESDADAAMAAMQGTELCAGEGDEKRGTKLSISKANMKGKGRQMASRSKKTEFQHQVDIRKMQLSFDPKRTKRVTSLNDMPRSYRVLADKNAKTKRQLTQELAKDAEPTPLNDDRAQAALDQFLQEGGMIEDVDFDEFAAEVDEAKARGTRTDEMLYGLEEVDDEDRDWFYVEGDSESDDDAFGELEPVDAKLVRIEEEEEERRNWEEYKRVQRLNRVNLHPGGDTKPSGALRSGQKKIKTWTREDE
jgi:hypothetical protein